MGSDKSHALLGRRTLLQHVRAAANSLKLPVRIIRRDAVDRCGPLGGIYTGLKRTHARCVMFLACDMPFITPGFLQQMLMRFQSSKSTALFARAEERSGFPCVLSCDTALPVVTRQISKSELSLQSLAKALRAKSIRPARAVAHQLINLNRPADLKKAVALLGHG